MTGLVQYILSSFWTWLGASVLIAMVFAGMERVINALHPVREITIKCDRSSRTVSIKNASTTDVSKILRESNTYPVVEVIDDYD